MHLHEFLTPSQSVPPLVSLGAARLRLPERPPGREAFPLPPEVDFFLTQPSTIQLIASGTVICHTPLTILHDQNICSSYQVSPRYPLGTYLNMGTPLAELPTEAHFKFSLGVSLFAPHIDSQHFMSLDLPPTWFAALQPPLLPKINLWRGSLPLENIPLFLRRAIVAVEDRRFYQHHGIDLVRIIKALLNNLRQRQIVEGASTITQQAARSALHITKRTWFRKLIELPIALALERFHSKNKILELYFDSIYWGRGATNVAAAAIDFFGKNVWALNFKECALLAGLPNHPLRWEVTPIDVQRLEHKGAIVLDVMRTQKIIDDTIYNLAQRQTYTLVNYE